MSDRRPDEQPDLGSRWLSLQDAAEQLGVHYMTMYRYVRTGRLAARRIGGRWWVDADLLAEFTRGPSSGAYDRSSPSTQPREPKVRTRARRRTAAYPRQLADRLAHGDELGSWSLVEAALGGGATPEEVYLELLGPAMEIIGNQWSDGTLTVAGEHIATATMMRILTRLAARARPIGRRSGVIVIGAAPGDNHGLPAHLLADVLRLHQFEVIDLGANPTSRSFSDALSIAGDSEVIAVGIGCTTPGNAANLAAAVRELRNVSQVPVFAGGSGLSETAALEAGANYVTRTASDVVRLAEQLRRGNELGTGPDRGGNYAR